MALNRASIDPLDVDALHDSQYSNYSSTAVMVLEVSDNSGNNIHLIYNISGSAIDPNAVSTYDAAPTSSVFTDGPGGKVYVKSAATTWTTQV